MKDYTPADTLTAFVDVPEEATLPRMDRSRLERWALCPAQAALSEAGKSLAINQVAEVGEAVHVVIGSCVKEYIESGGNMSPGDLMEELKLQLIHARPDVQPEAIEAARGALWKIVDLVKNLNPLNIIRYDGGEGERSGQLAHDAFGVRLTSELDFLYADPDSVEVINEADWKTGRQFWTADKIRASFQFQFHAFLVLMNYPALECLRVRILNTRANCWSWSCEFRRRDLEAIGARIRSAVDVWEKYGQFDELPELDPFTVWPIPAWPSFEKCSICDCALACPACSEPLRDVKAAPPAAVDQLIALEAKTKKLRALIAAHGDTIDADVPSTDGKLYFGRRQPRSAPSRKPSPKLYKLTTKPEEDDGDEDEGSTP